MPRPIPARAPLTQDELPTNDPSIALGNLEAELVSGRRLIEGSPRNALARAALAHTLLAHGAVHGRLVEYDEAAALVDQAMKLRPDEPEVLIARAAVRARFHRFDDALDDLAAAAKRGAGGRDFEQRRAAILQARGRLAEARAIRVRHARPPSFAGLFALATVDADEGRLDEAEAGFIAAEQQFRDVAPFPLARLWLQQAQMWQGEGRFARARELLEAARERVPVDAAVLSHLASVYAVTGERDKAIAILRPLAARSDDPEHAAQLAALLASDPAGMAEARSISDHAAARFRELVGAHPEAFADHAARFYLGAGADPRRAVELADLNLRARTTADAFHLAIDAHAAVGDAARACELAAQAVAGFPRFAHLHVAAARAYAACGQPARAEAELTALRR